MRQNRLKNQIGLHTEYIQQNPYWRLVAAYYDTTAGLRMNHRPGYQQLLKDCRWTNTDLILVEPLSGLGCDAAEAINTDTGSKVHKRSSTEPERAAAAKTAQIKILRNHKRIDWT